jgi:hypothetical protein
MTKQSPLLMRLLSLSRLASLRLKSSSPQQGQPPRPLVQLEVFDVGSLAAALQLISLAEPAIASVIMLIRGSGGTTTAIVYLDSADAQFAADQKQVQDWLAAHGKAPAV